MNKVMALDPREVIRKANEDASSTTFSETIMTYILAYVERKVRENDVMRGVYRTIDMPSPTYNLPYQDVRMTVATVAELGDISAQKDAPEAKAKTQLIAKKLAAYTYISSEIIDDSIISMVDFVVSEAVRELALAEETAFINGDTGTYSAPDPRSMFHGVRKLCASNTNNVALQATPITLNAMNTAMSNVESSHYDIADYVWLMHPKDIATLRGMDEFEHADKHGGVGSITAGFQGVVYAVPVVSARTIPTNLNLIGGSNETVAILANKHYGFIGQRTPLRAYRFYQQTHDRLEIQWNERIAFNIHAGDLESHALVTGIVA